jgi:hypothetical protein
MSRVLGKSKNQAGLSSRHAAMKQSGLKALIQE